MDITTAATTVLMLTTLLTTTGPNTLAEWQASVQWMIIVGFLIAFILAFAVGANDVANSFGTTVGSGTLSLKQACILASIFETLGAILLGAKVGHTIRKGIIDVEIYEGNETLLMGGEVSAMAASGLWQLIATFLKLPVSGTHSIVGSTIGFSLVAKGTDGVHWSKLGAIVASWFLSPILSGIAAASFYIALRFFIFKRDDPITPSLMALPIMYGITVGVNLFSVLYTGTELLGFDRLSVWADLAISSAMALIVAVCVQCLVVAKMKKSNLQGKNAAETVAEENLIAKRAPVQMNDLKRVRQPAIMETIKENVSLENSKTDIHKAVATDVASVNKDISKLNAKFNLGGEGDKSDNAHFEEARKKRKQFSKRSYSTSSGGVTIPAILQLEKSVVQSRAPVPAIKDIREEIRRNFSEPAMMTLTQSTDADVYEVFINRHKSMITIQRKKTGSGLSEFTSKFPEDDKDTIEGVEIPAQLEEPFESDEEEGLIMQTNSNQANHGGTDPVATAPPVGKFSGAIEEGFRYLSETNQNAIAIKINDGNSENVEADGDQIDIYEAKENQPEVRKMFGFLQILTACFGAFAHGGNDVSNAIGPLIALWIIYDEGQVEQKGSTPLPILLYGGVGICCGLWVWGRRVIKTMGQELTELTPSRGFSIELTSALTVLVASNLGLPVSTTHCKVGAVVAVGWVRSRQAVDWKIFRNIVIAWFVTVPISGGLAAIIFALFRAVGHLY